MVLFHERPFGSTWNKEINIFKDEDYDIPMLTEEDFEITPISETIIIILQGCTLMRDLQAQR